MHSEAFGSFKGLDSFLMHFFWLASFKKIYCILQILNFLATVIIEKSIIIEKHWFAKIVLKVTVICVCVRVRSHGC